MFNIAGNNKCLTEPHFTDEYIALSMSGAEYMIKKKVKPIGINEDPVTGNANGPLGAYLVHHRLVDTSNGQFCFKGRQGEAINRLGTIEVKVKIEDNQPVQVQIGGEAVIAFKTEIEI